MEQFLEVIDMNGQRGDNHFWFKNGMKRQEEEEEVNTSFIVFVV